MQYLFKNSPLTTDSAVYNIVYIYKIINFLIAFYILLIYFYKKTTYRKDMTVLIRRVVSVFDRKTTMRLAQNEWIILQNICRQEKIARKELLELIEQKRDKELGLTAAVRLFSLLYMYAKANKSLHLFKDVESIISNM